jgi:putative SOS response-associated peptidase YedK
LVEKARNLAPLCARRTVPVMCGRYALVDPARVAEAMLRDFGVVIPSELPRYNVGPTQLVPIIRSDETGRLVSEQMKWGLVPFWDKSEKPKIAPINARSEEAFNKPMFRQSLQKRRALFPADGFFEWQASSRGLKVPYHIRLKDGRPFVIAGIYEAATEVRPEPTCALLTTAPNVLMAPIHNRMPVILDPEAGQRWLRPGEISQEEMLALCRPYPAKQMEACAVSTLVNNVRNNGPECVVPMR